MELPPSWRLSNSSWMICINHKYQKNESDKPWGWLRRDSNPQPPGKIHDALDHRTTVSCHLSLMLVFQWLCLSKGFIDKKKSLPDESQYSTFQFGKSVFNCPTWHPHPSIFSLNFASPYPMSGWVNAVFGSWIWIFDIVRLGNGILWPDNFF